MIESKFSYLNEAMEKWLHKLEDQSNRLQNPNLTGNIVTYRPVTSESSSYGDFLKNEILELEKQLPGRLCS